MTNTSRKPSNNVLDLLESKELVKFCAPMVRYSKVQFRNLVRKYGCDVCYTPMILADSFCKSWKARNNEFTTNSCDTPLITQFAANTVHDFVGASHLISPFCDGVDLNCGCPQRWAKQKGLGCVMLDEPEMIYDLIRQCRNQITKPFTISVKMRILDDLKKSVEICKQLEHCGVSYLTVHARTPDQLAGDVNTDALKMIRENLDVPLVVNGGLKTLKDCQKIQKTTKCQGVMVANGILTNPTLFRGTDVIDEECIQDWLNICYNTTLMHDTYQTPSGTICEKPRNLTFQCFHHHLVFMLEKFLTKKQRQVFNNLQRFNDVLNYIDEYFDIRPQLFNKTEFHKYCLIDLDYKDRNAIYNELRPYSDDDLCDFNDYSCDDGDGKYFSSKINDGSECDWSDIFLENG